MREVERFLGALWQHKEESGWILIWRLADKSSSWHRTAESAAASIKDGEPDVYVGTCLGRKRGGKKTRAKAADVAYACGIWADVDFGEKDGKVYPATAEDARALIDATGLRPTIVVHSGHGLQPWWLLGEIWPLQGNDRLRFARAVEHWQALLRRHAEGRGWSLDSTHDLARIMRVPGTINAKAKPVPVEILDDGGPRYTLDDFEALTAGFVEEKQDRVDGEIKLRADANPPTERYQALMENLRRFKRTWDRKREDLKDQSASAYCCALAHYAVQAQWRDQQIVDLMIAWRRKEGEALKIDRPDWYARTIAHVRKSYEREEVIGSLSSGHDVEAEDEQEARRRALEEASLLFNRPLLRFVQTGRDKAYYWFVFRTENGSEVRCEIGDSADLDSKPKVRARLRDQLGVALHPKMKSAEWQLFVDTRLMRILEREDEQAGDVVDDLRQHILSYLTVGSAIARDNTEEGWENAALTGRPFIRGDRIYLSARTLRQRIQRYEPVEPGFYARLRAVGFKQQIVNVGGTTRSVWSAPVGLLDVWHGVEKT